MICRSYCSLGTGRATSMRMPLTLAALRVVPPYPSRTMSMRIPPMLTVLLLLGLLSNVPGQTPEAEPRIPPGPLRRWHSLQQRQSDMPMTLANSLSGASIALAASLVVHLLPAAETERVPHPGVDTSLQDKGTQNCSCSPATAPLKTKTSRLEAGSLEPKWQ